MSQHVFVAILLCIRFENFLKEPSECFSKADHERTRVAAGTNVNTNERSL